MPRYDFRCPKCGKIKELTFRTFEDAEKANFMCDRVFCRTRVERQPAAPNFQLKGSGWTPKHYGDK